MNKILASLACLLFAGTSFAQVISNGFYRAQNVSSNRYIKIIDDYGSVNKVNQTADMAALKTVKGTFDDIVSDPSIVLYLKNMSGNSYDVFGQGTNLRSIVPLYLYLEKNNDGSYKAYSTATAGGLSVTKYLCDDPPSSRRSEGVVLGGDTKNKNEQQYNWYFKPVNQTDGYYFGIKPDITVGNSFYKSFYASFAYSFASENTKAYYVTKVDKEKGVAVYDEITGQVPAATPVFIKCTSADAASNKLNLLASSPAAITGNQLKGVYFCNLKYNSESDTHEETVHFDAVKYNSATMRVLGKTADGSLGLITATESDLVKEATYNKGLFIPANTFYLTVDADAPAQLKLISKAEYAAMGGNTEVMKGDANGDGKVNITDVAAIIDYIMGQASASFNFDNADVNGDGKVNITDVSAIIDLIMAPTALKGDANGDGKVNITDVAAVIDYVMGQPSANFNFDNADVNGDGKVNVTDATAIIDLIMK